MGELLIVSRLFPVLIIHCPIYYSSKMNALQLAYRYMDIFFSGEKLEKLIEILDGNLEFQGPLFQFSSAKAYIQALQKEPPVDCSYEIIDVYEKTSSVCLLYQFNKPGLSTLMAQHFEIYEDKIVKIFLVFDTSAFEANQDS